MYWSAQSVLWLLQFAVQCIFQFQLHRLYYVFRSLDPYFPLPGLLLPNQHVIFCDHQILEEQREFIPKEWLIYFIQVAFQWMNLCGRIWFTWAFFKEKVQVRSLSAMFLHLIFPSWSLFNYVCEALLCGQEWSEKKESVCAELPSLRVHLFVLSRASWQCPRHACAVKCQKWRRCPKELVAPSAANKGKGRCAVCTHMHIAHTYTQWWYTRVYGATFLTERNVNWIEEICYCCAPILKPIVCLFGSLRPIFRPQSGL
jgi:hypothetical protein